MVEAPVDLLIYVEDPGAANIVADLPSRLRDRRVRLVAGGQAVERLAASGTPFETWPPGLSPGELVREARPRIVVTGTAENPDQPGLALVAEAHRAGIVTAGLVDAPMNAPHRFRGRGESGLAFAPRWILVPDGTTRRNFVALGHPEDRVVVCGNPHFDAIRRSRAAMEREGREEVRRRLLPAAPADRPVVLFAAELSGGLNPLQYRRSADYTLEGRGVQDGRTEIVMEEFLDAARLLSRRPWHVLRIHPKNVPGDFQSYLRDFDGISQGGSSLEWIFAADLVVGMTSTLLVEALVMGRPVLSIVPREEERGWFPAEIADLIPCVTTRAELRERLPRLIDGADQPDAALVDAACPPGALETMARFLEGLIS